jgi:hypothetical protein
MKGEGRKMFKHYQENGKACRNEGGVSDATHEAQLRQPDSQHATTVSLDAMYTNGREVFEPRRVRHEPLTCGSCDCNVVRADLHRKACDVSLAALHTQVEFEQM